MAGDIFREANTIFETASIGEWNETFVYYLNLHFGAKQGPMLDMVVLSSGYS
jgi:hypothetical protein